MENISFDIKKVGIGLMEHIESCQESAELVCNTREAVNYCQQSNNTVCLACEKHDDCMKLGTFNSAKFRHEQNCAHLQIYASIHKNIILKQFGL